jgi:hypothetical protein
MEEVFIKADNGTLVSFDKWDERAIWMYMSFKGGSVSCTISHDQAKLMLEVLQNMLSEKEVI